MDLSSLLHPSPLLLPSLRLQPPHRRRCLSFPRSSTSSSASVFGPNKELTGIQPLINGLTPPLRMAGSVALALAAIAAGYGLGFKLKGKEAAIAGGAVLGAAGCAIVYKMNEEVPQVAAVSLHNFVAGCDDPLELRPEEIEAVANRYGVSKQDEAFRSELAELYYRFVYDLLPPGAENLKGNEIETITKFKSALGIDDIDAANAHIEIGRRIFRERLETGDRDSDAAQRLAFQKLIYVSNLVFGDEASTFLLPWKRLFKVTDAQIKIAIRENAKKLYDIKLNSIGRNIEPSQLIELRNSQLFFKLSDEIAKEMFIEHSRELIEENVKLALDILRSRSKSATGMPQVIQELKTILAFNEMLTSLKHHPEASIFAPGIAPVSLMGGEFAVERNSSNLKLLYRAYASESFPDGRLDTEMMEDLKKLRNILGLGKKETETIMLDIKSNMYKKRLSKAFNTDLASAPSKASYLQNLCEDLQFDPQNASKLHEEIYKQKLSQLVEDGELSDEDAETLTSYQVRLCIPQEVVDRIHSDICGKLFAKVVDSGISSGTKGFDSNLRSSIRKAAHGLRLSKDEALSITSKAVRKAFMDMIRQAKAASDKTEMAKELQKLIAFNNTSITPLVFDIKGEPIPELEIEVESESKLDSGEIEDDEEMKMLTDLKPNEEKMGENRLVTSQKEINLKDDLRFSEREDLYETYWSYSKTGEDTPMAFGLGAASKTGKTEENRLDQLGDILGLSETEKLKIRTNIAEKAFIKEADQILADGQLTKARIEQLSRLQRDLSLPDENAQKVIKNITRNKMANSIQSAINQGKMSIKEVRELKSAGIIIDDVIEDSLREIILKKTVQDLFNSGKGEFDEVEMFQKVPEDLKVEKEKARKVVEDFAKGRIASSLVQAVSMFRQKNPDGVVGALNDMLACDMAVPAEVALTWAKPSELDELYRIYLKSIPKPKKLVRLQFLLGLSDEKAFTIQDAAQEGAIPIIDVEEDREEEEEEKEEFVF